MDISKVRPDRIQEEKISDKNSLTKTSETKGTKAVKDLLSTGASEKAGATPENVSWSADAQVATEGLAHAKAAPDVRQDKVAALRNAIRNGSYQVNAKGVAEKMIQNSLEEGLLTRKG